MATATKSTASKAKSDTGADEVPTPGEWVQSAPGHYTWRPGTARDLDERHEPHVIHPTATGWTSEHGTWTFTGLPPLPEGGTVGESDTVEDVDRQIAELQARKTRLQDARNK